MYLYSKRKFKQIERRFKWFNKHKENFQRWYNNSIYFNSEITKYNFTRYFHSLIKLNIFYRFEYALLYLSCKSRSLSKILGYPITFVVESIGFGILTFVDYKRSKKEIEEFKKHKGKYEYYGLTSENSEEKEKKLENKFLESAKAFSESSKFIIALIVSIITITITIFSGVITNTKNEKRIDELQKSNQELLGKTVDLNELASSRENEIINLQNVFKLVIDNKLQSK